MNRCECGDLLCPAKHGLDACQSGAVVRMFRSDMEDKTGTEFCDICAEDATSSGLFGIEK